MIKRVSWQITRRNKVIKLLDPKNTILSQGLESILESKLNITLYPDIIMDIAMYLIMISY